VSAPPPILEGEAAEEYRRIGALLGPPELISELDRHVLVRFAVAWETWLDAVREIKTMSPVVSSNGRLARNPYLSVGGRGDRDELVRDAAWLIAGCPAAARPSRGVG
jgi:phage terminase small subunit